MAGGNKNIKPEDNTGGFHKNPQNINRKGRPKKIYTILKEKGYNGEDIKTAFGELAFYSVPELKKVKDDDKKPVIVRIVANQFVEALSKNDWNKIKEILEHVIGKPQTHIDHTTNGSNLEPPKIIFDE